MLYMSRSKCVHEDSCLVFLLSTVLLSQRLVTFLNYWYANNVAIVSHVQE